jgi:hypothetical protein
MHTIFNIWSSFVGIITNRLFPQTELTEIHICDWDVCLVWGEDSVGEFSSSVFGTSLVRTSTGTTATILIQDVRGLPWFVQANYGIVPELAHDCLLPDTVQVIIQESYSETVTEPLNE